MGWGLGDLVDSVGEAIGDAADAVADAAVDVADAAVDGLGAAGGVVGAVIGTAGAVVDTATGGLASDTLHLLDDTVLDAVDELTGGVIDVDYDGGQFSASVGVDGIAKAGASVGEHGVSASSSTFIAGTGVGLTDEGFEYTAEAGVDYGPLPYSEASIDVDPDGDASVHARGHVVLPTQLGLLDAAGQVDAMRADGAWGAAASGRGTLYTPSGITIAGQAHAAYQETADGDSLLSVGLAGSVSEPGVGTIGGGVEYERVDVDGVVIERGEAHGYVDGYGARVEAGAEYAAVTTDDGTVSTWETDVEAGGWVGTVVDELDDALADADAIETTTADLFADSPSAT